MDVLVAGGSGFVGRELCRVLVERDHDVTAASRSPDPDRLPDGVAAAELDVTADDPADLVAGRDAVVNCVALPSHVDLPGRSHEAVHLGGTRALVRAAEAADVERFVQLSALGAGRGVDVPYFRAKDRAERVVREAAVPATIYRPSVIFGDGAGFLRFLRRVTPPFVAPLPSAERLRVQPIWVGDLAPMLADGVEDARASEEDARHAGQTYELGGPERLTLAEVVRLVRDDPVVVPVPDALARAGFAVADALPFVPVGRAQYRLLQLDNTVADDDVTAFGVEESDLTTLGEYLAGERKSTDRRRPADGRELPDDRDSAGSAAGAEEASEP